MTDGRMNSTALKLSLIIALGFVFRLALLSMVNNPGLHDPVHYFNLGRRLSQGQGFTVDYIWHYSRLPSDITHSIDHWMPLTGVASALGIALGGVSLHAALIPFVIAGALSPLLAFISAKQLDLSSKAALFAAAFAACIPDLVLSSLRTDTTALNTVFICSAILLLNSGLRSGRRWQFALCGMFVGLAYLTRNDALIFLPLYIAVIGLHSWLGKPRLSVRAAFGSLGLFFGAFLIVIAPWLLRNQQDLGLLGPAETSRMFFMVEQADHYAYGTPITWDSMLQRQAFDQLIYKRLFELAAALKQVVVSLSFPLFLLIPAGALWLALKRDTMRLVAIAPPFIWLSGILIAYPILLPLKSQAGSFEKAFLTVTPVLIPLAAFALDALRSRASFKHGIVAFTIVSLGYGSVKLVQKETALANKYYASIQVLVDSLDALPDFTGDGQLRLMSQDPYILSAFGYASVMTPLASREDTLELAQQYKIDYLLMPAGRPALDALYLGQELDPRFVLAAHLADAGEKPYELYSFHYDD